MEKGNHMRSRLDSVDFLRGLVMVIMALDHTRDFFAASPIDPTDLTKTTTALFLTRWVTHFCAPVFVFLAGTGMFLSAAKGKPVTELSRFLLTRGLWLVFLELTVVRFGWLFNINYQITFGQVIWAIGWSMVFMALLVYLPTKAITGIGLLMIVLHNLLDPFKSDQFGSFAWMWMIFHEGGLLQVTSSIRLFVVYPLIPWIGVMAVGYGFGAFVQSVPETRRKRVLLLGLGLTALFVALRATNLYGDPGHWAAQKSTLFTVFSFVNCQKYPPSLLFLLMTLGPALLCLAAVDRDLGKWAQPFVTLGRVPLFYYILHLPLIHVAAGVCFYARYGPAVFSFGPDNLPEDFGYGLPVVYLAWILCVLTLYPLCRWFAGVKKRRSDPWLSYL
ncbi:MAG: heparan-alpha-glucosaminide N-acetyltransferase domain-containing protein [Blastocatellia bacterium]|nr:heparan-alpha-glucosaminide N-acetyltransferase domain-containing protein [Blastocatellia bacterium]